MEEQGNVDNWLLKYDYLPVNVDCHKVNCAFVRKMNKCFKIIMILKTYYHDK